jgi:hypothetical protein
LRVRSTTPQPPDHVAVDHETILPGPKRRTQQSGTPIAPPPPYRQKASKRRRKGRSKTLVCDLERRPDPRAFPLLHSLFVKLRQTFRKVGIPREAIRLTNCLRRESMNSSFPLSKESWHLGLHRFVTTLIQLLSLGPGSSLEPLEHLTLTDLVARPPMFVCILVPHLIQSLEMEISKTTT